MAFVIVACGVGGPMFVMIDTVSPFVRNCWRSQISSATLALCVLMTRPKLETLSTLSIVGVVATGLALWVSYVAWNYALELTSFSHTAIFSQTHPIWILLHDAATSREATPAAAEWAGVAWTLGGVVVTAVAGPKYRETRDSPPSALGDVVALIGALCYAAYLLALRTFFRSVHPAAAQTSATLMMLAFSFVAVAVVPGVRWTVGAPHDDGVFDWPRSLSLRYLLVCGVSIALGHVGITMGCQRLPAFVVSVCLSALPIAQIAFASITLGTAVPSVSEIVGGLITVAGIAFVCIANDKRNARRDDEDSNRLTVAIDASTT